ncbi:MAG: hypothetical protein IPM08_00410 [Actinomycetales bacterium]|nr:hypothetical protein [Actinomycetales bacterium]
MPATRPECSSGTDHVNRHAEDEDPRAAVTNYTLYAIPKDEWAPVAGFTRESVLMVHPRSERHAIEAMRTISQFVAWAHREGYPLDRDRMFTPDAVERYIATAATHLAVSSRATRRSDLRRFSRQITTKAPWPPDAPQLKQRRTLAPFTQDEIVRLWEVANTQSTEIRRRRFTGYLALANESDGQEHAGGDEPGHPEDAAVDVEVLEAVGADDPLDEAAAVERERPAGGLPGVVLPVAFEDRAPQGGGL